MLTAGDAALACSDGIDINLVTLSIEYYLIQTSAADWCGTGLPFQDAVAKKAMQLTGSACRATATRRQALADSQEIFRMADSKRRTAGALPAEGAPPTVCPSQHEGQG